MSANYLNDLVEHLAAQKGGLAAMAEAVQRAGKQNSRNEQDTLLAHITPAEAAALKRAGGSGRTDPETGRLHFDGDCNCDCGGDSGTDGTSDCNCNCDSDCNCDCGGDEGRDGGVNNDGSGRGDPGDDGTSSAGGSGGSGYSYGQYSGADFDMYGWGDPDVGFQSSPQDAAAAHAMLDAAAINQDAGVKGSLAWATTPVNEEEFQAQQDANNWAGYNASGGINSWGDLSSRDTSEAAISEYNSLGLSGALAGNPWGYTDLAGQQQVNWGSVARDAADVVTSGAFQTAAALTGYGAIAAGLGAIGNAAKGNYGSVLGTIGQAVGGKGGQVVGSVIGNLASGNTKGAIGGAITGALGAAGISGGREGAALAASQFDRGTVEQAVAAAAGQAIGSQAQSAAVSGIAGSLSDAINNSGYTTSTTGTGGDTADSGGSDSTSTAGGSTDSSVSTSSPSVTASLGTTGTSSTSSTSGYSNLFDGGVYGQSVDEDAEAYKKLALAIAGRKQEQQQAMGLSA